jgi:hypothetical protein
LRNFFCGACLQVMNVPFLAYMQATAACTWFMVVNNVYMGHAAGEFSELVCVCMCLPVPAHASPCACSARMYVSVCLRFSPTYVGRLQYK